MNTVMTEARWHSTLKTISEIFRLTRQLEEWHGRRFSPDGHLLGSIGEVVGAALFDLDLLPPSNRGHDARWKDKFVEIKLTAGKNGVAIRHEPQYLIVLRLSENRGVETIYNGPGVIPWNVASQNGRRNKPSNGQYQISLSKLKTLDAIVLLKDRVPERADAAHLKELLAQGLQSE